MSMPPRRVLLALAASLLLNMFLIGFMVARATVARDQPPPRGGPHAELHERGRAGRAGGPPIRRLLGQRHPELHKRTRAIHGARKAVRDALVAEPFDAQRLREALQGLREATNDAQVALHEALLDAAPDLSPEQRAQLSRAHRLWSSPRR